MAILTMRNSGSFSWLWVSLLFAPLVFLFSGAGSGSKWQCEKNYSIEILSFDPLMLYINNFVTDQEIDLLEESRSEWYSSEVHNRNSQAISINKSTRSSQSATLSTSSVVSECLNQRVKSLLGNLQHTDIEPIQFVQYKGPNDQFRIHQDWTEMPRHVNYSPNVSSPIKASRRFVSIFVYLDDSCEGGETYFPDIYGVGSNADGEKFSRTNSEKGLLVRPKKGSAILWNNLHMNGSGDSRLAHAGLPVKSGRKIGMNIFTVYYLDEPILGTFRSKES